MDNEFIVRLLTIGSLAGLLLAVGMKLSIEQVLEALRKRRETAVRRREGLLPKPTPEPPLEGDRWVRTTPPGFPLGGDGRVAKFEAPTGAELEDWRRRAEEPVAHDPRSAQEKLSNPS